MIEVCVENGFEDWRAAARELAIESVEPSGILWSSELQGTLFDRTATVPSTNDPLKVPREFVSLAQAVACFDSAEKWGLLYRLLFRLVHENRDLLKIESDLDVVTANRMAKAVKRDIHKFHAFVRFRRVECETDEIYVAWHEPHHFTVERAVPFFARRFGSMKFSIFTPKGCAHWDLKSLSFSEPADRSMLPNADEMEDYWLLYYRSIFNPFRLKVSAMKKEFPVRHWSTLPEAVLIPELIRSASERTT
jgi:uracil-DNA glycosylase